MGITSFQITPGQETKVNNPNPANMRFELQTIGGTKLSFPIAAGGSFTITAGTDIAVANLIVEELHDYGPRLVE